MNPKDQARHYNKIAHHWNGKDFNRENGIKQHVRALQLAKQKGRAIDIGCGSSGRIIDLLLEHGFDTSGLDSSIEMLNYAKTRHPELMFYHENIVNWVADVKYDFISAWDSIWHVPLKSQEQLLRKLCGTLADDGVIIFTSGAVDEAGEVSNPCLGQELYHAALGIPKLLTILSESGCICRHLENDDWPSSHLYIIAQKKNTL